MGDAEWDPRKAAANVKKHGVDVADAATALYDERAITIRDDDEEEKPYVTIGLDALGRVLVVVYARRGERPRLVSARRERRKNGASTRAAMKRQYDVGSGKRGAVVKTPPGKSRITIRLDDDVLQWFRGQVHTAGGGNYQTLINAALREYVKTRRESLEATLRRVLREELPRVAGDGRR